MEDADETPSRLQVDFDSEVNSHLFCVRGDLTIFGNRSLPYLMLNATLKEDGKVLQSTKYLMIDLQPGRDHGFEIAKDMRIKPGDYSCTLEISGPAGTLASETRRCQALEPWTEQPSAIVSNPGQELPIEIIEFLSRQEESGGEEEAKEDEGSHFPRGIISRSSDRPIENVSPTRSDESGQEEAARSREQNEEFVGSSSSRKYHLPECRYAQKIRADLKIFFSSREEAERQGYLPCKVCNP